MSYEIGKNGEIEIGGWAEGIAPSPFVKKGVADLKGVNISSINGEVSVAYDRVRQDTTPVTGGTLSFVTGNEYGYSATNLKNGTWIKATQTAAGLTSGHYYFCKVNVVGSSYLLYSDLGVTAVSGSSGTVTFDTLNMGAPIDYTVEQSSTGGSWRYYILDSNGIIWANGTSTVVCSSFVVGGLTTDTTWQAITPYGTSLNNVDTFSTTLPQGSINIMYATDPNNAIQASYLMIFTTLKILYGKNDSQWPSLNSGTAFTEFQTFNYQGTSIYHKSLLGVDQVLYFTDGPGVGIIQQKTGQTFDPASPTTYNYVNANYLMAPTDSATAISMLPYGNGLSIVVGGQQNNLYVYPTYDQSTATGAAPSTLLWMPEAFTQQLLPVNNYVLIFSGNKGNIYLTNGSTVVPILTVPDYVAGSENFVQDPYFVWGGAMYLRGRVFFSIKDQNSSHTGNCGGVWSFAPSLSYFINQDTGLSLRMEGGSSLYSTQGFNGLAWILFAGQEDVAQEGLGPQYVAGWAQTTGSTTDYSVDFSGTDPLTNGSTIIVTDAIPIGTFLEPKTYQYIQLPFSAPLTTGESVEVYYRTSLEDSWTSAGTPENQLSLAGDGKPVTQIIQGLNFEKIQLLQLKVVLKSVANNPSWCRLGRIIIG